jgi:hypothetical protein
VATASSEHHMSTRYHFQTYSQTGWPGIIPEMEQLRCGETERCGSTTGGFCRWSESSASSKVWPNRLATFSSDDILAVHSPIRLAVL